jgi:hypothetical protein
VYIPEVAAYLAARDNVSRLIAGQAAVIAALKALDKPAKSPAPVVLGVRLGAAHIQPLVW